MSDMKLTGQLIRRAVARERAAWRRDIGVLRRQKYKPREAAIWEHGYLKALDDLLQRRAQKGGRG